MIDTIHIAVCMKPVEGNFASNALEHGVAGLNIGGSRIGTEQRENRPAGPRGKGTFGDGGQWDRQSESQTCEGRFPSNVILDETVADVIDEQSGFSKSTGGKTFSTLGGDRVYGSYAGNKLGKNAGGLGDEGGAARFFKQCEADNMTGESDERTNQ
jgi:site-specific DNA-methyltransferase (adenine-specific)